MYVLLLLLLLLLPFLSGNERVSASQPASQHENSHEEKESVRCAVWLVSSFVSVLVFWIFWITLLYLALFYSSSKLWSVVEDYGGIADIRKLCSPRDFV